MSRELFGVAALCLVATGTLSCSSSSSQASGGTGECSDSVVLPLSPDESSTLGFSANEMLAAAAGPRTATVLWEDADGLVLTGTSDQQTSLNYDFEPSLGSARAIVGRNGPCMDHMVVDGTLVLVTEDGALNERIPAPLEAFNLAVSMISVSTRPDDLKGTLRVAASSGPQPTEMAFSVDFWPSEWKGSISVEIPTSVNTRSGATIASW